MSPDNKRVQASAMRLDEFLCLNEVIQTLAVEKESAKYQYFQMNLHIDSMKECANSTCWLADE